MCSLVIFQNGPAALGSVLVRTGDESTDSHVALRAPRNDRGSSVVAATIVPACHCETSATALVVAIRIPRPHASPVPTRPDDRGSTMPAAAIPPCMSLRDQRARWSWQSGGLRASLHSAHRPARRHASRQEPPFGRLRYGYSPAGSYAGARPHPPSLRVPMTEEVRCPQRLSPPACHCETSAHAGRGKAAG